MEPTPSDDSPADNSIPPDSATAANQPQPSSNKEVHKVPKWRYRISSVCLVLCALVSGTLFYRASTINAPTLLSGPTQVTMGKYEEITFYVPGVADDSASTEYTAVGDANCTATGPKVVDPKGFIRSETARDGTKLIGVGSFQADEEGTYTITCTHPPGVDVYTGPGRNYDGVVLAFVGTVILFFGVPGFLIPTFIGMFRWANQY